jgi:hypothetical protein
MVHTAADLAVLRVNETYRPRHSPLSRDETMSFQCLHHRIHRGRRHEKVPLNVGFRRSYSESQHVLFDELEVLALAVGWPIQRSALAGTVVTSQVDRESISESLDQEGRAISEVNGEP